jgi:PAS domain S-box-containing protein
MPFCLVIWAFCLSTLAAEKENPRDILTFKELFHGTTNVGAVARIPAVVTYVDPTWKMLFVQDETGGCLIRDPATRWNVATGDRVLVGGRKMDDKNYAIHELLDATLQRIGPGQMPKAMALNASSLLTPEFGSRLIEVHGTVRSFVESSRLQLSLMVDGQPFATWVHHFQSSDLIGLLDAEATVQGICSQSGFDNHGLPVKAFILAADFKAVRIDRPGPAQPFALERTSINRIMSNSIVALPKNRVLIRGSITQQKQGTSLALDDGTGEMTVLSQQLIALIKDDQVEAIGFPALENGSIVLTDARFRVIEGRSSNPVKRVAAQADAQLQVLTSIKQVLNLSRDQARKNYPVQLSGVVTYFDSQANSVFIQDGDDAIYANIGNNASPLKLGQWLDVSGMTKPGGVLTMISAAKLTVRGERALPEAQIMNYLEGLTGRFDCKRVRVKGVVQSTLFADNYLNMDLVAADGRFYCTIPETPGSWLQTNLINKLVEIDGICMLQVNSMGTASGLQIAVQRESDIRILQATPTEEFAAHLESIGDVFGFIPPGQANHRLKVKGVVTLWRPGRELYVQDSTGAIRIQTDQIDPLELGDEVEVVGYRSQSEIGVMLKSAEYFIVRKGGTVSPKPLRASEALSASNHAMLVQIDARLLEDVRRSSAPELVLEDGRTLFTATLEESNAEELLALRANSRLRVTGVCFLRMDESREVKAFRLLVRTPADVLVISQPVWFTIKRILAFSFILLVPVFAALGWITALRRRVHEQTELIRRRLESEASTEHRLALVWEASADGMRMTDANGMTIQVNGAYCRMVQKSRAELEGQPFWAAFQNGCEQELAGDYRMRFASRLNSTRQETSLALWNGQQRWFDLSDQFIEHTESSPLLLSQFRDITERKLAEEEKIRLQDQLIQAQKTESIGRLAGGVAHDFNNMLQVIMGNTILALDDTPQGSPVHEAMEEILKSAQRSADLTRQLLAFARKQTISPKILDLNDTVASMLKMLQRLIGENIHSVWIPGANLGLVKVDPAQIDQILVNLCVNARDAIAETGRIAIETANAVVDPTQARSHPDIAPGEYVTLAVSYTGRGMDSATQEHLFEPFFTTKDIGKGTGLGLATVFGIVKQNHGFIEVRSEPGKGSAFKIFFPRESATASAEESRAANASLRGNETILLVEDEEQILALWRRTLAQCGYCVLAASNPGTALKIAEQDGRRIDLLVTDVIMPRMNGKELFEKVQALQPGIRCIFMSGYTADVIAHHGVLEDGIHFLQKPFTVHALTKMIRETIERKDP